MIIIKKIPKINFENKSIKKNIFDDTKNALNKIEKRFNNKYELIRKYGSLNDVESFMDQLEQVKDCIKKTQKKITKIRNH